MYNSNKAAYQVQDQRENMEKAPGQNQLPPGEVYNPIARTPLEQKKKPGANRQSFIDAKKRGQARRQDKRAAAREKMGDAYKTDITKYDHAAAGGKKFGMADVRQLRKAGYSNKEIKKYSRSLGADQMSEGLRHNHAKFSGKHATKAMGEGASISDFDVGKGFNKADVKYLRSQGFSNKEIAAHANQSVKEGGKRHGAKMAKFMEKHGQLDYSHSDMKGFGKRPPGDVTNELPPAPGGGSGSGSGMGVDNSTTIKDSFNTNIKDSFNNKLKQDVKVSQEQNINQDNDINTNINGNNNTVLNNQDNSIRQYGGDTRIFNYQSTGGSGGGLYDSPVSAATMGGFYGVDDSPAAQAKFNDLHSTINADKQKRYAGEAMKTFAMFGNMDARNYTDESMQTALGRSTQYSFDRADRQTGHTLGDIWNPNYITEQWQMPDPPKPIESEAEDIADEAKKKIEDI